MKFPLTVVCLICSLTAWGQERGRLALDDLIKLAEQGDADTQHNLGVRHEKGRGVLRDYGEAVKWYRLAAEQGDTEAQYNLGVMYGKGQGVPQDYVQARMWLNLAASKASGSKAKSFAELRDTIAVLMTPQQIADAQRLAREWRPKTWDELKE